MTETQGRKPVVIEMEPEAPGRDNPADAPPVPEPELPTPQGQAMQMATGLAARKPSLLSKLFWWALGLLITTMVSVAFWDFAANMMARNFWLGRGILVLIAILLLGGLSFTVNELAGMLRLRRIDVLKRAYAASLSGPRSEALRFATDLRAFYGDRPELRWNEETFDRQLTDALTGDDLLHLAETTLMAPLDQMACREIESAARQVATATAIVPLALADVVIALTANIRMVRRIAQVYGGRAGRFGSWRLLRAVATHLVATGAVAITDDLIGTIAGGGVLSKVSRRFGEGVVNGALTARVGIAAMEVCRPMPFATQKRPTISGLMKRALTGFFGGKQAAPPEGNS